MNLLETERIVLPAKKIIQPHEVDATLDSLWTSFCLYLGLPSKENPNPSSGYKFETDVRKRDSYLGKAIRMRNKYAALASRFDTGRDRLVQMTDEITGLRSGTIIDE